MQSYKFESNSQPVNGGDVAMEVAISDAKIQIWKQFTTHDCLVFGLVKLQYPMQRYKFESNSQLMIVWFLVWLSCNIRCKDTNLKAIHNVPRLFICQSRVAISDAKIQIWKQFTTDLLYYVQVGSCNIRCKDTNLKAIHNRKIWVVAKVKLQYPMQRYKFESNSQPVCWI